MKRLIVVILLLLSAAGAWSAESARITILHTNDLHGMMLPHDYIGLNLYSRRDAGGLARRSATIKQIRESAKDPVVTIDCGDIFTRGPWHKKFFGVPEVEAMNLMAYDMMCIGNNEFKAADGPESQQMMLLLMRRSRFPWLAANLTVGKTGIPPEGIHPFIVRDFNGLRVGFLGLTAPRSSEYPQTSGWTIADPIESAAHWVPLARKECDVLVAVTHIGAQMDEQLAAKVAGIDAIVGGDSHTFIPKARMVRSPDGTSVPIVQAGEQGVVLGRLDLAFERTANAWRVTKVDSSLMPMTSAITEDPAMKSLLARWLELPAKSATDPVTSSRLPLIPAFQY